MNDFITLLELDELLDVDISLSDELIHYGTPRHSGRYPWGSGENPYQHEKNFLSDVRDMKKKGMTEAEIAKAMNMNTAQLRARYSVAKDDVKKEENRQIMKLKEKGYSNSAIAEKLGFPSESTVRSRLNEARQERLEVTQVTANFLRDALKENRYLDVGSGTENHLGISRTKLKTALEILKDEGYEVYYIQEEQVGTGEKTTIMTLCPPGSEYKDVYKNRADIRPICGYSEDGGKSYSKIEPPRSVDSSRIQVIYAEDGGAPKDGLIELRRGVDDISMKDAKYCQVRIAVDGTHYIKGMAVYSDDLPEGIDIRFNTSKHNTVPIMGSKDNSVLKPIKKDPTNPFGATIKLDDELILAQRHYIDENGDRQLSALNIVNEEGTWGTWSKNLSSQMLSKQTRDLAKKQLDIAYDSKVNEYNDIMSLTNPVVRQHLLESFAGDCDAAAVHLKAAGLPRQASHVILPVESMKDNEVYAPNYNDGERVVLIRYPHGGRFEIPDLVVNNKNPEAKKMIGQAPDAIGINNKVAQKLSGADFDGDTVLVIPNNNGAIKTKPSLAGLDGFDPKEQYPKYEGMKPMTNKQKQQQMGDVSNLITDMTLKGATDDEICRAVKHSMVIIDAEKHELNYKKSYIDNGIRELKEKYQGVNERGQLKGASTLISRASSDYRVDHRTEGEYRTDPETGKTKKYYIDPDTGEKLYTKTGETYYKKKVNKNGEVTYKETKKTIKSTKMAETTDARTLSSGTRMEEIYANYANKEKALANRARKEAYLTKPIPYSPSAKKVYAAEVASLDAKLNEAKKNAPLERQAQLLANKIIAQTKADNPSMDADDIKKLKGRALSQARSRVGSGKKLVDLTSREIEAIQAGAISTNKLKEILTNSNLDKIKQQFMPRETISMTSSKIARARQMLNKGYTQAEVANLLGVSVSTLMNAVNK